MRDRLANEHVRKDDLVLRRADTQPVAAPQLRRDGVLQRLMEDVHRPERRRELPLPDAEDDLVLLLRPSHRHTSLTNVCGLKTHHAVARTSAEATSSWIGSPVSKRCAIWSRIASSIFSHVSSSVPPSV